MAVPTQPTPDNICTEAWKLFGKSSPTSSEITRAKDYGLEWVKGDLKDAGLEWSFLRKIGYLPTTANTNRVQCPTDFAKVYGDKARLLDGTRRGTAQSGAAGTITLASADSGSEAATEGKLIVITSGTGSGQGLVCSSYNDSTKVATMEANWTTTPDNTSVYLVVDSYREISMVSRFEYSSVVHSIHPAGSPRVLYHEADAAEGDLFFDRSADKAYAIELPYYADLLKVDIDVSTSTLYNRILRLLNHLFIQGVFVWTLQDDNRYAVELQKYERMKQRAAALHLYPNNVANLDMHLDYP